MPDLTAKRTLVKSPPELWEELSEVEGLMKHLSAFGEIKITKLEPEHTVAWEGEHASGTVSIEPSGWGTKVTLHAELPEEETPESGEEPPIVEEPAIEEPVAEAPVVEEPVVKEPIAEEPQPDRKRRGFWGWLFRTRTAGPEPEPVEPVDEGSDPHDEPMAEEREVPAGLTPAEQPEPAEQEPEPEPEPDEPEADDADPAVDPERARAILDEALDALGAAHHRPFSRG